MAKKDAKKDAPAEEAAPAEAQAPAAEESAPADDATASAAEAASETQLPPIPDPAQLTVQELKAVVDSGHLSGEQLERIKAEEEGTKGRKQALDLLDSAIEAIAEAEAFSHGQNYLAAGHYRQATRCFERARAWYEKNKDAGGVARCVEQSAILAMSQGDSATARARYQEALTLYEEQKDAAGVADIRSQLQILSRISGEPI